MSIPIVSVVGNSSAGKTTFLEKLIRELKRRGYRLAEAGSDVVMISSPRKLALLEKVDEERSLDDLAAMVSDRVDVILTEGYRRAARKISTSV